MTYVPVTFNSGDELPAASLTQLMTNIAALKDGSALNANIITAALLDVLTRGGWYATTEAWSYVSADGNTGVISIPSGGTTRYTPGMRIQLTQSTVKYFIITAVASTTLTVWGGTDYTLTSGAISAISYSPHKAPVGFPLDPDKWSVIVKDTADRSSASPSGWQNLGGISITIPIGVWRVGYWVTQYPARASGACSQFSTLSKANNTEDDKDFTAVVFSLAGSNIGVSHKEKILNLAAKTVHYLNATSTDGVSAIVFYGGSGGVTIVKAICAYL